VVVQGPLILGERSDILQAILAGMSVAYLFELQVA